MADDGWDDVTDELLELSQNADSDVAAADALRSDTDSETEPSQRDAGHEGPTPLWATLIKQHTADFETPEPSLSPKIIVSACVGAFADAEVFKAGRSFANAFAFD